MHRKSEKRKIAHYAQVIIVVLIFLMVLLEAVRLMHVKMNIEQNDVKKVISTYDLQQSWYVRNGTYYFTLPDGDRLSVARDLVGDDKLMYQQEQLLFTYASPRGGIRFTYDCVEITSADGKICFVNQEEVLRETTGRMWIFYVISVPLICFAVIWWISDFRYSRRYRKWRQKRYVDRKKKQALLKRQKKDNSS